jgi:hypothetical protein
MLNIFGTPGLIYRIAADGDGSCSKTVLVSERG